MHYSIVFTGMVAALLRSPDMGYNATLEIVRRLALPLNRYIAHLLLHLTSLLPPHLYLNICVIY